MSWGSGTSRLMLYQLGCGPRRSCLLGSSCPAQRLHLFEPLCDIAEDRADAHQAAVSVAIGKNREFDRETRAVLADRRHRKDVAIPVARLSSPHRLTVGCPMPTSEVFGHDDVERHPDRLL